MNDRYPPSVRWNWSALVSWWTSGLNSRLSTTLSKEYRLYPNTVRLMEVLQERSRSIRPNNQRVNPWVGKYLDQCLDTATPVTILTQWCLTKGLERRVQSGSEEFRSTPKEQELWSIHISEVIETVQTLGFGLDWYVTFNRGFTDSRRLSADIEESYKQLIQVLAESCVNTGCLGFLDWEGDVIVGRSQPDLCVLQSPEIYVKEQALEQEIAWADQWMRDETTLTQTPEEVRADVIYQIACEAEEGKLLASPESPLGSEFILVPLEIAEQYDFFAIHVPDFKKRIAAVLPPYPWRLK